MGASHEDAIGPAPMPKFCRSVFRSRQASARRSRTSAPDRHRIFPDEGQIHFESRAGESRQPILISRCLESGRHQSGRTRSVTALEMVCCRRLAAADQASDELGFDVDAGRLDFHRSLFAALGFLLFYRRGFGAFVVGLGLRRVRHLIGRNGTGH